MVFSLNYGMYTFIHLRFYMVKTHFDTYFILFYIIYKFLYLIMLSFSYSFISNVTDIQDNLY